MVPAVAGADVVHSHTWYANFAGHTAGLLHGVPHVVSAHSLEPLRTARALAESTLGAPPPDYSI